MWVLFIEASISSKWLHHQTAISMCTYQYFRYSIHKLMSSLFSTLAILLFYMGKKHLLFNKTKVGFDDFIYNIVYSLMSYYMIIL